jgi:hypothetical protein
VKQTRVNLRIDVERHHEKIGRRYYRGQRVNYASAPPFAGDAFRMHPRRKDMQTEKELSKIVANSFWNGVRAYFTAASIVSKRSGVDSTLSSWGSGVRCGNRSSG